MAVSVFDLFKIGIGPSSSHTVGPMRAARLFALRLQNEGQLQRVSRVLTELYGSLGATGKGHGTDKAVLLGLEGEEPDRVDVDGIEARLAAIRGARRLTLLGTHPVAFDSRDDLLFYRKLTLDGAPLAHANGMRFIAFDESGLELAKRVYYSVGGGFVVSSEVMADGSAHKRIAPDTAILRHPFHDGEQLLAITQREGLSIAQVMRANERHWRGDAEIDAGLLAIWQAMQDCVARGLRREGELPGGFRVKRRSPRCSAAVRRRSRTPPRSAWSITTGSPAIRSAGWCRSRASNATRSPASRRSTPRAWRWPATARTTCRSTR
jgi:L-serine dehydratase